MTECMHHAAAQCGFGYCGLGMQKENNDAGIKKQTNKTIASRDTFSNGIIARVHALGLFILHVGNKLFFYLFTYLFTYLLFIYVLILIILSSWFYSTRVYFYFPTVCYV